TGGYLGPENRHRTVEIHVKFIRDTQDYLQKRVYKWQGSSSRRNFRYYRNMDGASASSSDSEHTGYALAKKHIQEEDEEWGSMSQKPIDKGCIPDPREVSDYTKHIMRGEFTFRSNLTSKDKRVIKPADKGRATVIMDYLFYKNEVYSQLTNTEMYQPLSNNPTSSIKEQITTILEGALQAGLIDKKQEIS
ncbi:unnamed protein product, partial [Ranitomeya imitator]